jgi:hypothetical protein
MMSFIQDFSVFISALWPVVAVGLGCVLAVVLIAAMVQPFRSWVEK